MSHGQASATMQCNNFCKALSTLPGHVYALSQQLKILFISDLQWKEIQKENCPCTKASNPAQPSERITVISAPSKCSLGGLQYSRWPDALVHECFHCSLLNTATWWTDRPHAGRETADSRARQGGKPLVPWPGKGEGVGSTSSTLLSAFWSGARSMESSVDSCLCKLPSMFTQLSKWHKGLKTVVSIDHMIWAEEQPPLTWSEKCPPQSP